VIAANNGPGKRNTGSRNLDITKIVRVLTENVELAAVFPRYLIPNILERGIQIQM